MTRRFWAGGAMLVLGVAFCCATPVNAGGKKSDSKVKAEAKSAKIGADGTQKVSITLTVEKNWYIYANPVGAEDFENNQTRVTFQAKGKLAATVKFPEGTTKTEVLGKDVVKYKIYQDRVVIEAELRRTPGDGSPLQIKIGVNACKIGKDGKTSLCLEPGTIVLMVP